ncbi:MAG: bifunctional adenosylcobinamide kinase/adenosylcobinamide-phosphate guanylyltransferase [Deltaproteobacteria bacterium]|nr:bifunctional adenosylcobinamide kinase/adenosylcobinamide-phosphate guanylyltransferase [Candidatus Anaeroferrophillus wilburensis]MBN2889555.1 bifunctional adenosylcobinamide kinase/adenosylcobinamide-phosphate guanylyltransferase [Deltaproteobacteria bacterium]
MDHQSTILITGGARSGKSTFAQQLAEQLPGPRAYLATAQIHDQEMAVRVARHQELRGSAWQATIEEPYQLHDTLQQAASQYQVILVDCITLWLTNLLLSNEHNPTAVLRLVDAFLSSLPQIPATIIFVTNEVGSGIVPDNPLGRAFRDLAGTANQRLAAVCQEVYLVCCGLPLKLK